MAAAWSLHLAFGLMARRNEPIEARHVKFGVEIDNKYLQKWYKIYMLSVTNMMTVWNFEVMSGKFNVYKISSTLIISLHKCDGGDDCENDADK
jgi:hypothetical protein